VIVLIGPNSVFTLSLHMGNGSIENQFFSLTKRLLGACNLHTSDISFAVTHETKFTKNPQMQHIATLKRIMKYL
jgi:hypothetical protein